MGSITHAKVSGIADGADTTLVRPSDWNAGHTISLDKTDVGLGNVDNTSDTDKPVSSATQTALSGKSDTSHTHTGLVTNGDSHNHSGGDGGQISHLNLSNIGTNAHSTIDTFISSKAAASGLASLDGSSLVVQNPANATATPTASKIPIADASGTLDSWISLVSAGGWIPAGTTWTYASADDPTYTFTITGDYTGTLQAGMKVKLTQTTVKYFIITKVEYGSPNTTVTVYGGADYDLANATITLPYYSHARSPIGFPMNHGLWMVRITDSSDRSQATPVAGTWYNIGTTNSQITLPLGVWNVTYRVPLYVVVGTGTNTSFYVTLSNANNTEWNAELTYRYHFATAANTLIMATGYRPLAATSATILYLNSKTPTANYTSLNFLNTNATMVLEAVCAYL